jgi:spore germination protein GerM
MPINKRRILWVLVFVLLFSGGIAGGFFYFAENFGNKPKGEAITGPQEQADDSSFIRVYFPSEGRLIIEERKVKRLGSVTVSAEEIVEAFLSGPSNRGKSDIPPGTKVLGLYFGTDGILYVDLSDEFRRNFHGDALSEFLLLKGLYESIISNVMGVDDVKILIEGKEMESIGGHLYALYPLKTTLTEVR